MILIIAGPEDLHARYVAHQLSRKSPETRVRIADMRLLAEKGSARYRLRDDAASVKTWTDVDGASVCLDEVRTIWYRRIRKAFPDKHVRTWATRGFVIGEWEECVDGMLATLNAWFVNEPTRQQVSKPRQLQAASKAGLAVPDTLITNDPTVAMSFVEEHQGRVVHKPLTGPPNQFLATKKWEESDREVLSDLSLAPTIFQQFISDGLDLRVTVVGDDIFPAIFEAAKYDAAFPDSRILTGEKPWRRHELPFSVQESIHALMNELGLVYGAIDMKLTPNGEYFFLEVNPQGQYLFAEILSGLPITDALTSLLLQRRDRDAAFCPADNGLADRYSRRASTDTVST